MFDFTVLMEILKILFMLLAAVLLVAKLGITVDIITAYLGGDESQIKYIKKLQ